MTRKSPRYRGLVTDSEQIQALAAAISMGMGQVMSKGVNQSFPASFKEASITPNTTGTIYGRYSIFDPCSNGDIFGLQVQTVGLMNWLGWRANKFYRRHVEFLPWYGPSGTAGSGEQTAGAGSPCADPNGWEWGQCGYNLVHTSWYHRAGDGLDPHTILQDRCETSPRYRVNGVMIADDLEWQMNGIMNVLQQDIRRALVHGSHNNAYEMDGLESIIKDTWTNEDGTTCPQIGSKMIDWAGDDLDGEANGLGNFFNYLDEVVTEIERQASALGMIAENDMALVTARFMATKILDSYACYTICGVTDNANISDQALRAQARQLRFDLNAGPLYDGAAAVGYIKLKSGRRLPILVDDTIDIAKVGDNYSADIYLLTRRVGGMDVLYGEYLDMGMYENRAKKQAPTISARADAAGRFLLKSKEDNWCISIMAGTSPELYLSAPWAQARIEDVAVAVKRQPVTGDIFQVEYLPGGRPLHKAHMDW